LLVIVEPGTILQIAIGTVVCAAYLMFQLQAQPYINLFDNYLAQGSSFSLLMFFFCCILYQYDSLTASDDLKLKMTEEQRHRFIVPSSVLTVVLFLAFMGSLIVAGILVITQIVLEKKKLAKLEVAETGAVSTKRRHLTRMFKVPPSMRGIRRDPSETCGEETLPRPQPLPGSRGTGLGPRSDAPASSPASEPFQIRTSHVVSGVGARFGNRYNSHKFDDIPEREVSMPPTHRRIDRRTSRDGASNVSNAPERASTTAHALVERVNSKRMQVQAILRMSDAQVAASSAPTVALRNANPPAAQLAHQLPVAEVQVLDIEA